MSAPSAAGLRRKVAFLCCGAFGFALYTVASLLLVRAPRIEPEVAAFVAVLLSVPPTFLLQKHVAFRHRGDTLPSFAKYCALQAFNALAIAALARIGRQFSVADAVNLIASGAVVVVVSYVVLSTAVFRARNQGA